MLSKESLEDKLIELIEDSRDFFVPKEISRIKQPSKFKFYSDYVSQSKPVIITDSEIRNWPAIKENKWTNEYLIKKIGKDEISVSISPTGRADSAVDDEYFVKPHETQMKFEEFLTRITNPEEKNVLYAQHQNNSFPEEFASLMEDCSTRIEWGNSVFETAADAVNLWLGNKSSVSSLHQDPYENLYCVVSGEKHFTLFPPTEEFCLEKKFLKNATYCNENGEWKIIEDEPKSTVPWILVDPDSDEKENVKKFPNYKHASPIRCTVKPGEMLYLPAKWFHQVSQTDDAEGRVIAINYWFDMKFGIQHCYDSLVKNLVQLLKE